MVLPRAAERMRLSSVSMLLAQEAARASGGTGDGVSFTVADSVDPDQLRRFGGQPVRGYPGAGTLAELAVMPARAFVARSLENAFTAPPGATDVVLMPHRYLGEVAENDSVAHALYRRVMPDGRLAGAPDECPCAEVLEVRRVGGRWYVMPDWSFVAAAFLRPDATDASR
jgi:hypothetical protein